MDVRDLEVEGIVAFDGVPKKGLVIHPDQEHLIYPIGNKVTIKNIKSSEQFFLSGHTNVISRVCISPCGKFIASGQINHLGFKAMVIIWDYQDRKIRGSHEIHKVRVEDICFSCKSNYLISLGGRDDGNIVIWDVLRNDAICGAFASSEIAGNAYTIETANIHAECFITGGDKTLKIWRINAENRKVTSVDVKVGKLRRAINCIVVDCKDEYAFCGTASGDIIKIRLNCPGQNSEHMELVKAPIMVGCYSKIPKDPKKLKTGEGDLYGGGVNNLLLLTDGRLLIGAGDGSVELVQIVRLTVNASSAVKLPTTPQIKTILRENIRGSVTSMVCCQNQYTLIGTDSCEIYQLNLKDFDMRLLVTCHTNSIYDIVFPHCYSEIFATASKNDIRLWQLETQKELLRITVPNFVCSSVYFSYDGRMIISAWNDGIIRAFTPQTGKLIFQIHNAHLKAVSAVAITMDGRKVISGGCDGQVRVWEIKPDVQRLHSVLKEHRGSVTSLHISYDNTEVVSSSTDGTCIIWDIVRCVRKQVLMGNTMYLSARFSPNGVQVLTCGTDRKIAYWETLDGSLVREIEGSTVGSLNCVDISPDGRYFVTGSNDSTVRLWEYHLADVTHIGMGHAAIITACKFSPDSKHIVTVSADGGIMIWKCPFEPQFEKSSESSVRSDKNSDRKSEKGQEWEKSRLRDIKEDNENVVNSTHRSEDTESVKAVHKGDTDANLCNCNPLEPNKNTCNCKEGEERDPTSIRRSAKSHKSDSRKSNRTQEPKTLDKGNEEIQKNKVSTPGSTKSEKSKKDHSQAGTVLQSKRSQKSTKRSI